MENAAKSIIMVGGVIIGALVVSIMVYMFAVFGSFSGDMASKINSEQSLQFNNNFYKYEGRVDITAQEIVTCANFAKEHNKSTGLTRNENGYVKVFVGTTEVTVDNNNQIRINGETANDFINNANLNRRIYGCCVNNIAVSTNDPAVEGKAFNVSYDILENSIPEPIRTHINGNTGLVDEIHFIQSNTTSGAITYDLYNKELFTFNYTP